MDGGLWHCIGKSDQDHALQKMNEKSKKVDWGGLTNSWEKNRRERQKRKGKIYPSECRIARRDKKAFLSVRCKDIEENNRMGKTRGLFKKIRDTKGTFHVIDGHNKRQ